MLHSGPCLQSSLVMWLLKPFMTFLEQSRGFLSDLLREPKGWQGHVRAVLYGVCTEFRDSRAGFPAASHALILLWRQFSLRDCQVSVPASGLTGKVHPYRILGIIPGKRVAEKKWHYRRVCHFHQKRFLINWLKVVVVGNLLLSIIVPMYLYRA